MELSLWQQCLQRLRDVVPQQQFGQWINPLQAEQTGDGVVIFAPNQYVLDTVNQDYLPTIEQTLTELQGAGVPAKVSLVIGGPGTSTSAPAGAGTTLVEQEAPPAVLHQSNLNVHHTFDNFVEGKSNQLAKAAALQVAENPGSAYNPLFMYGGVGLGKTHLMHAIGNQAVLKNPNLNVVVVTSERFTLDFVNSLRKNKTIEFAQQYRSADMLLIDDVQFFRGKEQTQEQFFHTFNVLHQSGKQIVMTADKYPGEMKGLQARLLSRFQSGLSVDVQPPNFEVRVAILLEKAEQNGVVLEYEFIEFIAKHIKNNVRDLEGAVIRVLAKSSLLNREIDHFLVRDVVRERIGGNLKADMTIEEIVKKVSEISSVPEKEIVGKSRKMEIAQARQVSMFLSREILGKSLSGIGMYFGGRDHTTVMHAIKTISEKVDTDDVISNTISKLRTDLNQSF